LGYNICDSPAKEEFLKNFSSTSPDRSPKRVLKVTQIDRARSRSPKHREDPCKPLSSDSEEGEASDSEVEFTLEEADIEINFSELQVNYDIELLVTKLRLLIRGTHWIITRILKLGIR